MSEPVRSWHEKELDSIRSELEKEGEQILALKERIGKKQWQIYASDTLARALHSSAYSSYTENEGKVASTAAASEGVPILARTSSSSQITRHFFSDPPPPVVVEPKTRSNSFSHDSSAVSSSSTTPTLTPTSETLAPEDRFSEAELVAAKGSYDIFLTLFDQVRKFKKVGIPSFYAREIIDLAYITTELSSKKKAEEESPGSLEYFLSRHYSHGDATYLKDKYHHEYNTKFPGPKPSKTLELEQKTAVAEEAMENFKDQLLVRKAVLRTNNFSKKFFDLIEVLDDYKFKQMYIALSAGERRLHPADDQRVKEEQGSPKPPKVPPKHTVKSPSGDTGPSSKGSSPTDRRITPKNQTHSVQSPARGLGSPPPIGHTQANGLRIHQAPLPSPGSTVVNQV